MPEPNLPPEPTPEESLLQQAIESIRAGHLAEAREMLTKLLKIDQHNPEYWVWLSAAMETSRERLYCLQTANQLDPTNAAARRGLILMGALSPENPPKPFPMNHPRPWEARFKQAEAVKKPKGNPMAFRLGAVVGVIALVVVGGSIALSINLRRTEATPIVELGTARPTVTPYATNSNAALANASTLQPLSVLLSTPYTPTPVYAATPHGDLAGDSYRGALRAYKNGQWDLMGMMMAQVATAQPGSADALYFIGESYRLNNRFPEAIDYYNQAITLNPKYAPSYLGRALANMSLTPPKNDLDDLNYAIDTDPNYVEAYIQRGLYYLARKDLKSAMADLEKAAALNDSALVEINRARILLAMGENAAAVEAAKSANEMDVTMLDDYLVLGMAYRANGQVDQSVNVLETYLKYQPDNAEALALLGAAYFSHGDYSLAEDSLVKSMRLDPNNKDGYYWLGQTYLATKENDKALTNFLKARELDQDSFEMGEGLAKAYIALGQYNNSYIAIIKVEKSAVTPEERARFIYIRALSLDQLNQPDAAYRDWSDLLSMPADVTTPEMVQMAQQRMLELRTSTPTVTSTPTITSTPTPRSASDLLTPRPTDTRFPTSTPKGTPAATATPSPTP